MFLAPEGLGYSSVFLSWKFLASRRQRVERGPVSGDQDDGQPGRQRIHGSRDAFGAGRDLTINYYLGKGEEPPSEPTAFADGQGVPRRRVWGGVPARNPGFAGRRLLGDIWDALVSADHGAVLALHGMGGVGKTQLAAEYAHRRADEYDTVWWVDAERAALIGEQYAALAQELRCAPPGSPPAVVQRAVLMTLREQHRWLLIFDNAEDPRDVADWLPGGRGHVLITSRAGGWHDLARPVGVHTLERRESVQILRYRVPSLSDGDAEKVAEAVGDLPLALAQAAGYMAETAIAAAEYADLIRERAAEILEEGPPPSHRLSLTAVTQIAFGQVRDTDRAATELLTICAFLAPAPVRVDWFTTAAAQLAGSLRDRAEDAVAWRRVLADISRSSLARIEPGGIVMHRLTQSILRSSLPPEEAAEAGRQAAQVLIANDPSDPGAPRSWPAWGLLLPHLLTLGPGSSQDSGLRQLAARASEYLLRSGQLAVSHDLAQHLHGEWATRLGSDHPQALQVATNLARTLHEMGRYEQARQLDAKTLEHSRRTLGDDHPDTLISASNLAANLRKLGDLTAARQLAEDTLARRRQVLGEDHPMTLVSSHNLALVLSDLGESEAAATLAEDTYARSRHALGDDHPDTLSSAHSLAIRFCELGDFQAARALDEETLTRRLRVLGQDHPNTLASAHNLADDLRELGDVEAARQLDQDTLVRRRRILGEDHPSTRSSTDALAEDLRLLGQFEG